MQENVEFDNGKNEGDEITSFAEEEVEKTSENKNNKHHNLWKNNNHHNLYNKTQSKIKDTSLSQSVSNILTVWRLKKIIFDLMSE